MTKKAGPKQPKSDKAEPGRLPEDQLDEISGGPHFQLWDGHVDRKPLPERLPVGSIRQTKI